MYKTKAFSAASATLPLYSTSIPRRNLTSEDLREIDDAASQITLHGERYSEAAQRMINR